MQKLIFSKVQLLEELGIVENTLRALIEQRGFPRPRKMGAKLFWLISEVAEWLQGCPAAWVGAEDGA
ncbi:helix-turn-helix transcriptional regulator [Paracidovorax valerianellae]|uniref:helix-turn-helix transcriptional regulator n=1 Tax=Paracidovorax valerianellae TaxID=187868 RepID=UPI002303BCD0|nr:hypothetical protein [Paracidovorax valerianellae]MDA8444798.1 hypothetical protein [Paracidovorax valerianellae]UYL85453.1 AlpA family regulatory protein [Acidovorax phage Alfacinha3]UYL85554.1 AlpA family regulatory protein [Acidovorax phage Alfacinha1]